MDVHTFLSRVIADLAEDAGEGFLSEIDLKLLSLDL